MIIAMVEGLEARLQDTPDDLAGWQRLIQARRVLEDEAGLLRALSGAAMASPTDKAAQLALLEYGLNSSPSQQWQLAADRALANLAAAEDAALEYLFFAGHIARLKGQTDIALGHFESLAARIETIDSVFHEELMRLIAALKAE